MHRKSIDQLVTGDMIGNRAANAGLGLLYRRNGLHISPSHGFMSAAHTDEDITHLIEIYQNAMEELRAQGVW
jgi:glutamate-1-semialdehyde aminotransferase